MFLKSHWKQSYSTPARMITCTKYYLPNLSIFIKLFTQIEEEILTNGRALLQFGPMQKLTVDVQKFTRVTSRVENEFVEQRVNRIFKVT